MVARAQQRASGEALHLEDEVVDEVVGDELPRIRCENCALWSPPSSSRQAIEKIGARWTGDCFLQPTAVKKAPDERCGQHSELVRERAEASARAIAEALAPAIERGLAAIGAAIVHAKS